VCETIHTCVNDTHLTADSLAICVDNRMTWYFPFFKVHQIRGNKWIKLKKKLKKNLNNF
jgi:hypothetical protein